MPTLGDIAVQVQNSLNQIQTNTMALALTTGDIKGDTADIKARLDAIKATLLAGFATLGSGLFAIHEAQKETAVLLADEVEQKTTIICWLVKEADLLCRILRRLNTEIEVRQATQKSAVTIARILGRVHAREKLEQDRASAIEARIEKCCPPAVVPPEACYEPCRPPRLVHYDPRGQDWKPPKGPEHKDDGGIK